MFPLISKATQMILLYKEELALFILQNFDHLLFQMQIYITGVQLLLSSGAVSAGLEKVLRQAKFIADIYHQFRQQLHFHHKPCETTAR